MGNTWWRSRWGRRAAGAYILLVSAASGYVTYHLLFTRSRSTLPADIMVTLGLPWTRTLGGLLNSPSASAVGLVLVVSFVINAAMLCFIGSRFEQLARGERQ